MSTEPVAATDVVEAALARCRERIAARPDMVGLDPEDDQLLVAEIARLRAEVERLRAREERLVGALQGLTADFGLAVMAIKTAEDEATLRAANVAFEKGKP